MTALATKPAYVGRFAPSPTGPLHLGSVVAAFASWLDARAHDGRWLVRIEDVDRPRCTPGAAEEILRQLSSLGLNSDGEPLWQSTRDATYARALDRLMQAGWAYPCACSRRDIEFALAARGAARERHGELVYPGTCRPEHGGLRGRSARAVRCRTSTQPEPAWPCGQDVEIEWVDRRLGPQTQNVTQEVGDFVLRRADGLWAYQLAVVVDDADQGITAVVRGEDLADNTARQVHLQNLLDLPSPSYLHTPLVMAADGQKLSKQNGAQRVETQHPSRLLAEAGQHLGLRLTGTLPLSELLAQAVQQWRVMRWATNWHHARPSIHHGRQTS